MTDLCRTCHHPHSLHREQLHHCFGSAIGCFCETFTPEKAQMRLPELAAPEKKATPSTRKGRQ